MINREGNYDDGVSRQCTKCSKIYNKTSRTVTLCNECNSNRVKSQAPEKRMWRRAKARAKFNNTRFDIDVEDIKIPEHCPILGIKLKVNVGKSGAYKDSPSLDKIDPTKGYTKGNIQVISQQANQMKYNATEEELVTFANYILNRHNPA